MNLKLVLCAFVVGALLPIASSHSQPTPIVSGWSVGGWNFQTISTVATDVTNNGHNATAVGANTTSWGWANRGASLAGAKYYTVPYSPALSFASGDFSFGAYVRVGDTITTRTILDNRGVNGGYVFGISTSRRVTLRLSGSSRKAAYASLTEMALTPNRWHHVAVAVARSTGTVQFYIDGNEAGAWPLQTEILSNTDAPLLIGAAVDGTAYFNDRLDEVHLYNRALSFDEIATVMAPGYPMYEPSSWNGGSITMNNCYNYANNKRTNTFAQPGRASGQTAIGMSCAVVHAAAVRDGLEPIADPYDPSYKTAVALVVAPGEDYHWYRRDAYGTWSHKPGQTAATNLDNSGSPINDPQYADRGPYTDFCGYFRLWSDSVQAGGHEEIR
ncbi:hypothetical protein ASE35_13950 [Lysobacter sp. Root916]|uniref:LamG domain-containing protein n=1 Tax=Lysobacter sp. Root916 TaxID=1736606 RepID=UPI00070A076D|nr:LamG domain-containing protein [Lysobacter sp. Root916]KRD32054.1 hypothetical protein ASE35_13950 [Lysobacter sp. Root916]